MMLSLTSTPIKSVTFHLRNVRPMLRVCLSKNKSELMAMARMCQRSIPRNGCAGGRVKSSRTHVDVLLAANAKQVHQSTLNVRLGRAFELFEGTRRREWA